MNIAVGCPVTNRAWILPQWFRYLDLAFSKINKDPTYIILYGTSIDSTWKVLQSQLKNRNHLLIPYEENPIDGFKRMWDLTRYHHMVDVRNALLREVRRYSPDLFLSIDSDILINPDLLVNLLESIESADAVGGKVYMNRPPDKSAPSYGKYNSMNNLIRHDSSGVFLVDAIMALKMMKPSAYSVDYIPDKNGEDLGWSRSCREKGLVLMWDGRLTSTTCSG